MKTMYVDPTAPDAQALEPAAKILRRGGLVAFPTETVYGLGANALDAEAVRRIFAAKGRPSYNPLIVHVAETHEARPLVREWPDTAEKLASAFWPGPLTLILPKRPHVPDEVSAGLPTVAIRVPAHPVAHALLRTAGLPIAAPSANRFTELSPTTAQHVEKALGDRVDLILDGGPTQVGIESTVLDLSGELPALLRPGTISLKQIEEVVGPVVHPSSIHGTAPRPSPGMVDRHYSPRAELRLFRPEEKPGIRAAIHDAIDSGETVAVLAMHPTDLPAQHRVEMPAEPAAYATRLYATLHELDDVGCDRIYVERVPVGHAWAGVRDRLDRAARGS